MSGEPSPRPTDVGREEMATTRFERFLALVLAVFMLIGLLWLYAEPLDRTGDHPYDYSYTYVEEPKPAAAPAQAALVPTPRADPAAPETGPVDDPRPGDQELVKRFEDATRAVNVAENEVAERSQEVESTREAYRTRLDAGEPAEEFRRQFVAAEQALKDAEGTLGAAAAELEKIDLTGRQAQQRLAKAADDLREQRERDTFLLRLSLTLTSLALSVLMLHQLHRRRPRYTLVGMSAVGAATGLAIVMTGDYIDIEAVGPIVLAVTGIIVTLGAFVAYQRWLARRLPERRVRKGECPFCGYPSRDGTHCQGCGRAVVAACTTCAQPRRVGSRYCGACGADAPPADPVGAGVPGPAAAPQ